VAVTTNRRASATTNERFHKGRRLQHPEYIANWAAVLRTDNKATCTAGAQATEAVHFLHKAAGFTECAQERCRMTCGDRLKR
jgi:antirestriction protein ArdC